MSPEVILSFELFACFIGIALNYNQSIYLILIFNLLNIIQHPIKQYPTRSDKQDELRCNLLIPKSDHYYHDVTDVSNDVGLQSINLFILV